MFEQIKYDRHLFEDVKLNYSFGNSYDIELIDSKIIHCPTLDDFEREVWDLFADFCDKQTVNIIWGSPNGLRASNPKKPYNPYFDGTLFYLIKKEFMECIENKEISRFFSCLVHFNYGFKLTII